MKGTRLPIGALATHGVLILAGLLVSFPFLWMLASSLKTLPETTRFPPTLWPREPQWGNFAEAWAAAPFGRYFLNSAFIAASVTAGVLVTALLAGYAFGALQFPGRQVLFTFYLATMMIPFEVIMIPDYLIVARLGWLDRYPAMIVPWTANVFSVFLMTQFFRGLPRDFFEAAVLDGCSHGQFLWRIAAPLAQPALATVAIFAFLGSWNALLWPILVTKSEEMRPVEVGLSVFLQEEGTDYRLLMAASTLVLLPILLVFLVAQRRFIEGVSAGIKG
jgi:ABC-type glycerol-3-phosphate transport system permease component